MDKTDISNSFYISALTGLNLADQKRIDALNQLVSLVPASGTFNVLKIYNVVDEARFIQGPTELGSHVTDGFKTLINTVLDLYTFDHVKNIRLDMWKRDDIVDAFKEFNEVMQDLSHMPRLHLTTEGKERFEGYERARVFYGQSARFVPSVN